MTVIVGEGGESLEKGYHKYAFLGMQRIYHNTQLGSILSTVQPYTHFALLGSIIITAYPNGRPVQRPLHCTSFVGGVHASINGNFALIYLCPLATSCPIRGTSNVDKLVLYVNCHRIIIKDV